MTNSCQSKWTSFAKQTLPPGVSPIQEREMCKAFYAGFVSCLRITQEIAEMNDDAGVAVLQGLHDEMYEFGLALERSPT